MNKITLAFLAGWMQNFSQGASLFRAFLLLLETITLGAAAAAKAAGLHNS
jgi:hypothetical protein